MNINVLKSLKVKNYDVFNTEEDKFFTVVDKTPKNGDILNEYCDGDIYIENCVIEEITELKCYNNNYKDYKFYTLEVRNNKGFTYYEDVCEMIK